MGNILQEILENRKKTLDNEIKNINYLSFQNKKNSRKSISHTIGSNGEISIISEIKPASPSLGKIRTEIDVKKVVKEMQEAGVIGISILTEPNYFYGSFENLNIAVKATKLPCLMKDFVFDEKQFQIASQIGATNILLINSLGNMERLCEFAAQYNLEPVIEIHEVQEIKEIEHLKQIGFKIRLIGVNNRDLKTLKIDFNHSKNIIPQLKHRIGDDIRVISESGIQSKNDIDFLCLYKPDAFLIGSLLMKSSNIKKKIIELRGLVC